MRFLPTTRLCLTVALLSVGAAPASAPAPHFVNLIATHNSTFQIDGASSSELDLVEGEAIVLRVEAHKAKSMNRDGSVHGLVLLDSHLKPVPGWELLFKPGVQQVQLTAPSEPGIYEAVCTVICSTDHEHMKFRVVVRPK